MGREGFIQRRLNVAIGALLLTSWAPSASLPCFSPFLAAFGLYEKNQNPHIYKAFYISRPPFFPAVNPSLDCFA